ncbi:hypothetical protein RRG08_026729 [Elysia crispata]|uniref:Uncharacterized protein n=1 Tax=Elysia crispata TaxID=231223 RepID=A0AAE1AQ86_9GAST|nr:hypothetical protein RRG08_026729 [Elysia crispata]
MKDVALGQHLSLMSADRDDAPKNKILMFILTVPNILSLTDSYLATLITITETSCCRPRLEEPKSLPPVDGRGKHASRPHKMSNELRQRIKNHISSFRGRQSHYSQEKTRRLYLPEELNISKMFDLFKER